MLNYPNDLFLQSAPFEISFAGFRSDTHTLQNYGWTVAIEDVCYHAFDRHEIRFILRHEMLNLYAITDRATLNYKDLPGLIGNWGAIRIPFHIQIMAKDIIFSQIPEFQMAHIHEIDCRPNVIELNSKSIKDLSIFRTLVNADDALIIEPHRVGELLQKIVDAQAPNQKEIRERIRRSEARDNIKHTLHAQILSVAA